MKTKYKVWCKDRNEWEKDEMCLLPNGKLMEIKTGHIVKEETHILVFWTSLKEIYEGDIIKQIPDEFEPHNPLEVFWDEQMQGFQCRSLDEQHLYQTPIPEANYKIIGNIYENPELLRPNL